MCLYQQGWKSTELDDNFAKYDLFLDLLLVVEQQVQANKSPNIILNPTTKARRMFQGGQLYMTKWPYHHQLHLEKVRMSDFAQGIKKLYSRQIVSSPAHGGPLLCRV